MEYPSKSLLLALFSLNEDVKFASRHTMTCNVFQKQLSFSSTNVYNFSPSITTAWQSYGYIFCVQTTQAVITLQEIQSSWRQKRERSITLWISSCYSGRKWTGLFFFSQTLIPAKQWQRETRNRVQEEGEVHERSQCCHWTRTKQTDAQEVEKREFVSFSSVFSVSSLLYPRRKGYRTSLFDVCSLFFIVYALLPSLFIQNQDPVSLASRLSDHWLTRHIRVKPQPRFGFPFNTKRSQSMDSYQTSGENNKRKWRRRQENASHDFLERKILFERRTTRQSHSNLSFGFILQFLVSIDKKRRGCIWYPILVFHLIRIIEDLVLYLQDPLRDAFVSLSLSLVSIVWWSIQRRRPISIAIPSCKYDWETSVINEIFFHLSPSHHEYQSARDERQRERQGMRQPKENRAWTCLFAQKERRE